MISKSANYLKIVKLAIFENALDSPSTKYLRITEKQKALFQGILPYFSKSKVTLSPTSIKLRRSLLHVRVLVASHPLHGLVNKLFAFESIYNVKLS